MKKEFWAESKICTSKSVAECNDEFKRGCEMFISKGQCYGTCSNCHLQRAYYMTLKHLTKSMKPVNVKVIINGNVTINIKKGGEKDED